MLVRVHRANRLAPGRLEVLSLCINVLSLERRSLLRGYRQLPDMDIQEIEALAEVLSLVESTEEVRELLAQL